MCPCCGLISNLITSSIIITLIHTFENENEHGFKHSKYKYHPIMYFFMVESSKDFSWSSESFAGFSNQHGFVLKQHKNVKKKSNI